MDNLTEDNHLIYALKAYDKPNCVMSEFQDDYKRFSYLKKLLSRYLQSGELKERLILNHIVILYNVFGVDAATRLLFFKLDKKFHSALKTFLIFLNYMPNVVYGIRSRNIISSDINVDFNIANILRQIK